MESAAGEMLKNQVEISDLLDISQQQASIKKLIKKERKRVNKLFELPGAKQVKEKNTECCTLLQNNWNVHNGLNMQRMHFLQKTLNFYTLGFKTLAGRVSHSKIKQLELENSEPEFNTPQRCHLPSSFDSPDVQHTVTVSHTTLTNKAKGKTTKSKNEQLQVDFFKANELKIQQKDLENQHAVQLLLIKHQELRDLEEMFKLKEVETRLITESLICVERINFEMMKKCNFVFEDMKEKMATSHHEFAKQFKTLLEKYERLKKHFDSMKNRLREERTARKSALNALKKTQHMAEQLLMNQTFLEEQRDAIKQEHSADQKKILLIEERLKKYIKIIQRFKEERSAIKAEYGTLKDQLCISRKENQQLIQTLQSKELEKRRAEKQQQQLCEELKDSRIRTKSLEEQLEAMKTEVKVIHNTYKRETLQLQEQHNSRVKEFKASVTECEALTEAIARLKKDKHALQDELQCLKKEKEESETASRRDGGRMKEVVSLLERERKLLLQEMEDLRKDYFSLSDRITQRLGQLEQTDEPMCITDISPDYHMRTRNKDNMTRQTTPSEEGKFNISSSL